MELLTAWIDVEDVALELLEAAGAPTVLATPVEMTLPLTVVRCLGGNDDRITNRSRIQVQSYGSTRVQARDLAELSRQLIIAAPATTVAGASIDYTSTEQLPSFVDYGQPGVHRYIAMYRIEYRRSY